MDPPERAGGNLDATSFTSSVSPPVEENVKGTCVALDAGDAGGVLAAVAPFGAKKKNMNWDHASLGNFD